jgi:hypothetical protein
LTDNNGKIVGKKEDNKYILFQERIVNDETSI